MAPGKKAPRLSAHAQLATWDLFIGAEVCGKGAVLMKHRTRILANGLQAQKRLCHH